MLNIYQLNIFNNLLFLRAPKLWNIILNIEEKLIEKRAIFKATIKTKLLLLENAIVYF